MGRPADWYPLADADPVPGDPAAISSLASHLASVAEQIGAQVGILRKIAAGQTTEKGQHIEKLKAAASDTAGKLDQVTGRYHETAAALSAWAPQLADAQAQSLRALTNAQDAHARAQANQPVQRPSGTKLTPQDHQQDQARASALSSANADLDSARKQLDDAKYQRDQHAAQTAGRIEGAASQHADGFWQSLWGDIKSFTDRYANIIKNICTVLEVIATILAVVALFIPGLNLLVIAGIALTALALVGRAMLAATGNGSWLDVGLDAVAIATFGLGGGLGARLFGGALKGALGGAMTAVRSAAEDAGVARLLDNAPVLDRMFAFVTRDGMIGIAHERVLLISRSAVENAKVPEFAEMAPKTLGQVFSKANLSTVLPRMLNGGEDFGRTSAKTLSYIGTHFPEVDTGGAKMMLNAFRINYGIGAGLPTAAQLTHMEWDTSKTSHQWNMPGVSVPFNWLGEHMTTEGGL